MRPGLDTITLLRGEIGLMLAALGRAAEWNPWVLCLAFAVAVVGPGFAAARLARRVLEGRGHPWGAAALSSSLVAGVPLLGLWIADAATAGSIGRSLLATFSPALLVKDNAGPVGQDLVLATLPAAVTLCLVGSFALWAYVALLRLGGPFVYGKGAEANGLMRAAGLWGDRGPEKRFGLWAHPLANAIFGIAVLSLPAAVAGHLPPVLWIAAALVAYGFQAAAAHSVQAPAVEEEKQEAQDAQAKAGKPGGAATDKVEDDAARALQSTPLLAASQDRAPAACEKPQVPSADLFEQILAALGVSGLYRHQAKAVESYFAGEHVALFTPPASGRKVVRDALAMHAVLSQGASVLYLCRDGAEAERTHALFRSRSENAHWRWNVPAVVLSGRETLDLDRVQPSIVFAGFSDVHQKLLGDAGRYGFFLRSLELVAVTRVEAYQGPSADHLACLLSRLRRVVREAAGPAGLVAAGKGRFRPRLLLLADPVSPDVGKLAERVAAQRVTLVGEELDGAPVAQLRHVWLTRADGTPPPVEEAAATLKRLGVPWLALGLEDQLGRPTAKDLVDHRKAQAALVRADAASIAQLPLMLRHLGCEAKTEAPVVAFWMGMPDPLSRLLPGAKGTELAKKVGAPRLVVGGGSEQVARDHARCAMVESEWPADELDAAFGSPAVKAAVDSLPAVVRSERCEVDPEAGEVRRREFVRARRAQPHKELTPGIVGKALAVEDRATGAPVAFVAADRALAAAFPERILHADGRRYRVLPIADQERREAGVLWAELETREIRAVPVKRIDLEMLPDRRRVHAAVPPEPERPGVDLGGAPGLRAGGERRAAARRALAGKEFSLTWPRVRIRERIEGFRNVQRGMVTDAALYPEIIDGVHEGRAVVLAFPVQAGWNVPPAALHALVHLFRVALPTVLEAGPDDLDVMDLTYGGDPAIALVDLHPGGGGYAEAVTLDAVRSLATLSLAVVRGCSCRKVGGCPNCVQIPDCHSGFGDLGERTPSRQEAERVLCELIDPALLKAGDAVRYQEATSEAPGDATAGRSDEEASR